jgi:two-component system, chemotaxis family, sensor kinase CheA
MACMTCEHPQLLFLQVFLDEVTETLQAMEDALLILADDPTAPEALNAVFRAMHTIKGAAGAFGYAPVVEFTHAAETLMDQVRCGQEALTAVRMQALFDSRDHIARLVTAITADLTAEAPLDAELQCCSAQLLAQLGQPAPTPLAATAPAAASAPPQFGSAAIYDRYLEVLTLPPAEQLNGMSALLVSLGALTPGEVAQALTITQPAPQSLPATAPRSDTALALPTKKSDSARARPPEENHLIRVDAQRLGQLIDSVGELVTSSAAIRVVARHADPERLTEVVDEVEYLVAEIRAQALQLRMVAIGDSLARFRRVVRDVSLELGKTIDLVITGGETELDKTVVEKIIDPLTHLVRNAIDHGIELPELRQQAGKPSTGTIHLHAYHDSGRIVIDIADDGAGLDAASIRAQAEAKGLVKPDAVLTRAETLRLIFAPGLSTKTEATSLSGRGVGMDVVQRNIELLRGTVELDSQLGVGTKVTLSLPLTLAIIEGFLVGAGGAQYVIPLAQVLECVEMTATDANHQYVTLRGEVLPFIRLRELFAATAAPASPAQRESLVVVRCGHHTLGIVVDSLLGEWQTVIKPLGKVFERLRGVAGATILGTGEIALILDVAALAQVGQIGAGRY